MMRSLLSKADVSWGAVFRSAYTVGYRVPTETSDDGRTRQEFKDACDVNMILKRFERDGILEHRNTFEGRYGDFTGVGDFHEAMTQVSQAQAMFMTLPSAIRRRFGNDPGAFLDFSLDPENAVELRKMGLLPPDRSSAEHRPAPGTGAGQETPSASPGSEGPPAKEGASQGA